MKERGILFSAPMVRALLAGAKTQTRRVVQPLWGAAHAQAWWHQEGRFEYADNDGWQDCPAPRCPYGVPGDRLWVRETFTNQWPHEGAPDRKYIYRADAEVELTAVTADGVAKLRADGSFASPWIPAIHMPRVASRLTLEVTGVRVEKLHDISSTDAEQEGVKCYPMSPRGFVDFYRELWESINGAGSWDENPWVWVIEFKRINQEPAMGSTT